LVFAVDSVPAIFAITTDPYIVTPPTSSPSWACGALLRAGRRAAPLRYLKQALALLLVFIGSKIFVADLFGWTKFPAEWSLGVTFAILGAGVLSSLLRTRGQAAPPSPVWSAPKPDPSNPGELAAHVRPPPTARRRPMDD
jgi:tellurite resistance protein TerC